jgi:hypothetical protein
MITQAEITQRNHQRAVRFFWALLSAATVVSLIGNIVHAIWHLIPLVVIQIGAAAVPPSALLAAVHGIALAVRAGASGRVYSLAVGAVAVIGLGAFAVSFLALQDLMQVIGYSYTTAWLFPAIIDTAVAVSTLMLVALGDRPARRTRAGAAPATTQTPTMPRLDRSGAHSAKDQVRALASGGARVPTSASVQRNPAHTTQAPAQARATQGDAEVAQLDADLASELIASGVTTQPVETVIAVLAASREGASINAAAKASGINYRTAQRIVAAAREQRQLRLLAIG